MAESFSMAEFCRGRPRLLARRDEVPCASAITGDLLNSPPTAMGCELDASKLRVIGLVDGSILISLVEALIVSARALSYVEHILKKRKKKKPKTTRRRCRGKAPIRGFGRAGMLVYVDRNICLGYNWSSHTPVCSVPGRSQVDGLLMVFASPKRSCAACR